VVAGRSRTRAGSPQAVSRRTYCSVALRTAWSEHGKCESDTAALCKSNGKDILNPSRHGMAGEWAQHGHGMLCVNRPLVGVPRSISRYSSCVPIVSHAAGVKMEPVNVGKVIRSERGKDLLVIKGFKFRFQKIFADNVERWCTNYNVNAT